MKQPLKTWALALGALCLSSTAAFAQNVANNTPSATGWQNPVIPGYYPDPSVCRVGDDFYLVNSSFQFFPGVPVFHSKDLVHWEQIGHVLDRPSQLDLTGAAASGGIFAPTIRHHEGKYYMITTNIQKLFTGKDGNFIVTADHPAGPWSEPVWVEGIYGIDPSLFWEDGHCYITWSAMDHIAMTEIDTTTGKQLTKPVSIWNGTGGSSPEGPHIYKKDGYYYLLIAEGGTEHGHKVTIARSKSIYGPYESNPANPILTQVGKESVNSLLQGTGHADLVQATDGSWWMVYLGFRDTAGKQLHTLGRETNLAPVRWDEGAWPVVNATGHVDIQMNAKTLPQVVYPQAPVRADFSKDKLGMEWVYFDNPIEKNYVLSNNKLQLKATGVTLDAPASSPTFLMRRQTDVNAVVTTQLSLKNSRKGDVAGLTVYMDPHGHYDVAVVEDNGGQFVQLRYRLGEMMHVEKSVKVASGSSVQLRVKADANFYAFSFSTDGGKTFRELGKMNTFFLATETLGGFTGMMFGVFAQGDEGTRAVANVDWFDYEPGEAYKPAPSRFSKD